jgi:hypothetical protein
MYTAQQIHELQQAKRDKKAKRWVIVFACLLAALVISMIIAN